MNSIGWRRRSMLFAQRFWQPTSACMTCMPGGVEKLIDLPHWELALRTGLMTGVFVILLTFTPLARLYPNRFGNAAIVGILTAVGDAYSHANHYHVPYGEAAVTGLVSALIAIVASYVLEDRARRVRRLWARLFDQRGIAP